MKRQLAALPLELHSRPENMMEKCLGEASGCWARFEEAPQVAEFNMEVQTFEMIEEISGKKRTILSPWIHQQRLSSHQPA